MHDDVVQVVGLSDCDPMVLAFDLAPVQLAGESCDMGVRCVAPGLKEVRLNGDLFLGDDDVPRLELLNHRPNVLIFVTNAVFF